jgi:hypothetical protein
MKRPVLIIIIIAAAIVFYIAENYSTTVDYRGENFKMSKGYWSYEDYKDDPNNLNTNELERIEKVMIEASIGTNFNTREQFIQAVFSLKFPGYGLNQYGEKQQVDGSTLSMFSVEIPQIDKDRYFVARKSGGHLILVDDFVANSVSNVISSVKLEVTNLLYYDDKGLLVQKHYVAR